MTTKFAFSKKLLSVMAITVFLGSNTSFAQYYDDGSYSDRPGQERIRRPIQRDVILNQYLDTGSQILPVQQLGLHDELQRGASLTSLYLTVQGLEPDRRPGPVRPGQRYGGPTHRPVGPGHRPGRPGTVVVNRIEALTLVINNQVVDRQVLRSSGMMESVVFNIPAHLDMRTARIEVVGRMFVQNLGATLERRQIGGHGRGIELAASVRQRFQGGALLPVRQLIAGANPHVMLRGLNLNRVTLMGSSMMGRGQARLLINGMQVGPAQILGAYESAITFDVRHTFGDADLGQEVASVQIELTGNITVSSVSMSLTQDRDGSGGWGGQYPAPGPVPMPPVIVEPAPLPPVIVAPAPGPRPGPGSGPVPRPPRGTRP